ncbi:SSI family serine proteinase inhibitor [Streptomyces sp. VRA16 Mangrove soil]|uniref:SSI family serine proteinase inhibitor n=1 Tax=Streptomyces sp. VRA16 Mangrove soil TaxID=2817434 RepID=UPI001A9F83D3|nr:SSI family serine proteinase inhibitor [Streptomyces sp. VRA16 Mangrove soil]MBO1335507.1 serine protease [Streptomyces sp. VRA16 Mangrove soil]
MAVRTKRRTSLVAAGAAAVLLAAVPAGAAQAAPTGPLPGNWVQVTVMRGEGAPGPVRDVLLTCPAEPGADHPHADLACRELAQAGGDIDRLPTAGTACPMIYQPVRAAAHGVWDGRSFAYARDFSNACVLRTTTGSVFALDG